MRKFAVLVKTLLRLRYKPTEKKKSKMWIVYSLMGISFAYIIAMLCWAAYVIAPYLAQEIDGFVLFVLASVAAISLFYGMMSMVSYLFFNRDNEFLLSLPLKPATIFVAKLAVVYVEEAIISLALVVPLLVSIGIAAALPVGFYFLILPAALAVPLIPMLAASILAIPLMRIVAFFKSRGVASTIVVVLLFVVFFGGTYALNGIFGNNGELTDADLMAAAATLQASFVPLKYIFYTLYHLARLATATWYSGLGAGLSAFLSASIFLFGTAALFFLAYFLSSLFYRRAISAQLEGNKRTKRVANGSFQKGSRRAALILREAREIFRNPYAGFQCLAGVITAPIVVFVACGKPFQATSLDAAEASLLETMYLQLGLLIILMLGVSMNLGAATCISREGGNFFGLKILPVSARELVGAKSRLYLMISAAAMALSAMCLALSTGKILEPFLVFGIGILFSYAFNCFAMRIDINNPKLKWTSLHEVMKSGKNVMVSVFAGMGAAIFLGGTTLAISLVFISVEFVPYIVWTFLYLTAGTLALLMHRFLYKNIDKKISEIE